MGKSTGQIFFVVAMAWLGVAGCVNAIIRMGDTAPSERIIMITAMVYGVAAFATSAGVIRKKKWAISTYYVWCVAVFATFIAMQKAVIGYSITATLVFALVTGALWWIGSRVIKAFVD